MTMQTLQTADYHGGATTGDGTMQTMSTDEKGYNGWKNYETWATALHVDNEQGSYEEARRIVREAMAQREGSEVWPVADALKVWVEESYIDPIAEEAEHVGLAVDLLRAAFGNVDWFEIARNWMDEVDEEGGR